MNNNRTPVLLEVPEIQSSLDSDQISSCNRSGAIIATAPALRNTARKQADVAGRKFCHFVLMPSDFPISDDVKIPGRTCASVLESFPTVD
jgi:hypothetical protein